MNCNISGPICPSSGRILPLRNQQAMVIVFYVVILAETVCQTYETLGHELSPTDNEMNTTGSSCVLLAKRREIA